MLIKFNYDSQEKIWGKEDWIISAHDNGQSYIQSGKYQGMSLKEFFNTHRDLLGIGEEEFPLLVKVIEANDDLSIQVHPGDAYAKENENSLGKSECWYILDSNNSDIVVGQKAKNKKELLKSINDDNIMNELNIMNIDKGDFFYIPPGCVHAIRKGTKLLEVQQSSDITYRLYDYKRKGDDGKLRELHINKSLDVIDYEYTNKNEIIEVEKNENYKEEILTDNEYFIVKKITIINEYKLPKQSKYMLAINVDGKIQANNEKIKLNEGVMILKDQEVIFKGQGELILTTSK